MTATAPPLRIGNMSASRTDRATAMSELIGAGAVEVLAVDMLSDEACMQLAADVRDGRPGYESGLLDQLRGCLESIGEYGTRIVTNAGGLDPEGLAQQVRELGRRRGHAIEVAWIDGGVIDPELVGPVFGGSEVADVAIVRHGAFGIARALGRGADVVITGRVSREALVVGAAMAHHSWSPAYHDALAGAVAVGHVLSGGPGATGVVDTSTDVTRGADPVHAGFPIAEIATDGSCVVTTHPSALGSVTVGTVTDQLLDGISGAHHVSPDVVLRLETVRVVQEGTDRVRMSGARGQAPPAEVPTVLLRRDGDEILRAVARVARRIRPQVVHSPHAATEVVGDPPLLADSRADAVSAPAEQGSGGARGRHSGPGGPPRTAPLGSVAGVRYGIVGSAANLGVWTWDDTAYAWLCGALTLDRLRALVPRLAEAELERVELPNLRAVNVVVRGAGGHTPDADLGRALALATLPIPGELLEVDP